MQPAAGVLILGASARAAAWSALRAGLSPSAADLFADRDLAAVATRAERVDPGSYPDGLVGASETFPVGPWLYTGALENRPDLITLVSRSRPLWGNDAPTVRAARDPLALALALVDAGLPAPEVRLDPSGLPRDGSWLCKPIASAGGLGIEPLDGGHSVEFPSIDYYQRRVDGLSLSAVFVGGGGIAALAGVTRQLLGRPGVPFAYLGNVGPWPVSPEAGRRIEATGVALAARFGLVGLFGVDFLLGRDDVPIVVEVNPRYTASVEVIELATGRSLLAAHRLACEGSPLDGPWPAAPLRTVAKEILFAEAAVVFETEEPGGDPGRPFAVPGAADVPRYGTSFAPGDPVLTLFGEGLTAADALGRLSRERAVWRSRLGRASGRSRNFSRTREDQKRGPGSP